MHIYCLYCETQRCTAIAEHIEERYKIKCISPRIIQRKWVKGECLEQIHNWLPGYIFLYSEEELRPFFDIRGIRRWLNREDLKGNDLSFAQMIYNCDGVMGIVSLAEVGDRCVVDDPLWAGMEGRVVKLDRGRKRCCIEFTFDGVVRTVWVGYEIVKKV